MKKSSLSASESLIGAQVRGLTTSWQLVGHTGCRMFCSTVTRFLTNHLSPICLSDPAQINMTQTQISMTCPPVQSLPSSIVLTQLPLQKRPTYALNDSYSTTWAPCAPPLPIARKEETALIFCSADGEKSGFPIFQFLPATLCRGHTLPASQFANHSALRGAGKEESVCVLVGASLQS